MYTHVFVKIHLAHLSDQSPDPECAQGLKTNSGPIGPGASGIRMGDT